MPLKIILSLLLLSLCSGCSRTLDIQEDSGKIIKKEVSLFQSTHEEEIVEKIEAGNRFQTSRSCTYSGFCFICGPQIGTRGVRVGCGFGMHFNCPGTETVELEPVKTTLHYQYTLDKDKVYRSPAMERNRNNLVKKITTCSH